MATRVLSRLSAFLLLYLFSLPALSRRGLASLAGQECPIFFSEPQACDPINPRDFLPPGISSQNIVKAAAPDLGVLAEVLRATHLMQDEYYQPWLGTWPTSIDWTGAVMATHVSGAMRTFSEALWSMNTDFKGIDDWKLKENFIENYFSQIVAYYFGENALDIRLEAYDDILWVVLGWLEAVRFVNTQSGLHYEFQTRAAAVPTTGTATILGNQTWHGNIWIPSFAHRARIFWELGEQGWGTKLCGGGMVWNPRLLPYKNAITNELWIAASISMYLYFPGDNNPSPFSSDIAESLLPLDALPNRSAWFGPKDPRFLKAAVEGYKWLMNSNMTDAQGLFTDGFHIKGLRRPHNNNTKCDERNNMVFTYNQGVLLTGQRGLWEATGAASYLAEGHELIQNVINATGYDLSEDRPKEDISVIGTGVLPRWHGLGRLGVIEDQCDASGVCSQDSQTFKGIYFHHLTYFCAPLSMPSNMNVHKWAFDRVKSSHEAACARYSNWLKLNAEAVLNTRDADGKFGGWWTAGLLTSNFTGDWPTVDTDGIDHNASGYDYRTYGVPDDPEWQLPGKNETSPPPPPPPPPQRPPPEIIPIPIDTNHVQKPIGGGTQHPHSAAESEYKRANSPSDPNSRGRGRTLETQGSGLAVLRAYWSIAHAP